MVISATADGVSRVVADSVSVSFVTADVCIRCRADAVSLLLHLEPVLPQLCSLLHVQVLKESMSGRKSTSFVKLEKQLSTIN